jgi:FkbM family methyltransferase
MALAMRLGEILIKRGVVTPAAISEALERQKTNGGRLAAGRRMLAGIAETGCPQHEIVHIAHLLRWPTMSRQSVPPSSLRELVRRRSAKCGFGLTEGPSPPIGERWRSVVASARSLVIYYGNPIRRWRIDRLYSEFVREGDLVFDIGSHVGDRIGSFRRLGCRVVAVEPQPRLIRILRRLYGRDPNVVIEPMAIAAAPGNIELFVNLDNASLTTASSGFVAAASAAPGWRGERWPGRLVVPAITFDQLIATQSTPRGGLPETPGRAYTSPELALLAAPRAIALLPQHRPIVMASRFLPKSVGQRSRCAIWTISC